MKSNCNWNRSNLSNCLSCLKTDLPSGMMTESETCLKICKKGPRRRFQIDVLPTSRVGYHAGKPIENVVYCLNKLSYVRILWRLFQIRYRLDRKCGINANIFAFNQWIPPELRSQLRGSFLIWFHFRSSHTRFISYTFVTFISFTGTNEHIIDQLPTSVTSIIA